MQKRRVTKGSNELPSTIADVAPNSGASTRIGRAERQPRRPSQNSDDTCLLSFGLFFVFLIMLGVILFTDIDHVSHHPQTPSSSSVTQQQHRGLELNAHQQGTSLSKFSSLQYALGNAGIVGLYFAASWCPMSTPITNKIDALFSSDKSPFKHRVLSPDRPKGEEPGTKEDFALVYVSSDYSEEDMTEYSKNNWINVPYDSEDRNDLKRHFRICAAVEMHSLGIETRRDEIPSLVIIDSLTQGVLSISGKDDILEHGEGVLDHWINLQHLMRSLEEKYVDEE